MQRVIEKILLLSLACLLPCAMAESSPDVVNALKLHINGEFTIHIEDIGDLNNDGRDDWVGMVSSDQQLSDSSYEHFTMRIYVLIRNDNGLELVASSKEVPYSTCNGRCMPEVYIRKTGGFYVSQFSRGGGGASGGIVQFLFYKNQWRAVGRGSSRLDSDNNLEQSTDENFLTGAYITTFAEKNKRGKIKQKIQRGMGAPTLLLLEDFDLNSF